MGKGLQKIMFSVGDHGITHYGGLVLFHQFCKSLRLKRYFQQSLRLSHRPTHFHSSELLLAHFYLTLAGISRLNHTSLLRHNGLIPPLLGLSRFPTDNTLRNFLRGFTAQDMDQLHKAHDVLRHRMLSHPHLLSTAIVDCDSTVLTVYGHQEQAEVGYNPAKRGRRSYRPLLAFESHLKTSLMGQLRPGNLSDRDKDVVPFVKAALEKLPSVIATSRIRVRTDSGFYGWPLIRFLDGEKIGYAIVAQCTKPIQNLLPGLPYRLFNRQEQLSCARFSYQPHDWKQPHPFIAIRHRLPPEGQAPDRKLLTIDRFDYHVIVSPLDMESEAVWHFYRGRADLENRIKELKMDFFLTNIPTRTFIANQVQLQLLMMEYDLFRWFQVLCLPPSHQNKTLETIRRDLLLLPARLISSGHKNILRLPEGLTDQPLFNSVFSKAGKVKPLI
jgi:hypothetical protein